MSSLVTGATAAARELASLPVRANRADSRLAMSEACDAVRGAAPAGGGKLGGKSGFCTVPSAPIVQGLCANTVGFGTAAGDGFPLVGALDAEAGGPPTILDTPSDNPAAPTAAAIPVTTLRVRRDLRFRVERCSMTTLNPDTTRRSVESPQRLADRMSLPAHPMDPRNHSSVRHSSTC